MTPHSPAVIVMVKAPMAGTVKTRLTPPLSPDDAVQLAAAFAQDVVAGVTQAEVAVVIAHAPAEGRPLLEALLPSGLHWTPQRGENLGERMFQAMIDAQAQGFGPLIVIGTDSPTLPTAFLTQAISALHLDDADITLGPTEDGGYYLVGTQRPLPGLFDAVAWSTPLAFAQTADNAVRLGLRCLALPPWYDIDTSDDLDRLRREVLADPAVMRRIPATAQWLKSHPTVNPASLGDAHRQTSV